MHLIELLIYKGDLYTTGNYWLKNLKELGHKVKHFKKYSLKNKSLDLLIRIDDAHEDLSYFKNIDCPKILIATDTTTGRGERLLKIGRTFDLIFFPQRLGMKVFSENGYCDSQLFICQTLVMKTSIID